MECLGSVYKWQDWPRHYEPTDSELANMSDDEYDDYWEEQCRWYNTQHLRQSGRSAWKVLWRGRTVGLDDLYL
jgi:predicted helicase